MQAKKTWVHRGDLGDLLACIPVARALGANHLMIGPSAGTKQGRESLKGARFESIKPLLQEGAQDIHSVEWMDHPSPARYDFTAFRYSPIRDGENLIQWQGRHVGLKRVSEEPWLSVPPSPETKGRVLMARSSRYHNPYFPIFKLLERFPDLLFVGLPEEHKAFQQMFSPRKPIQYRPTKDLLELAGLIAGCKCLLSNQTAAWWIGAGLGVPLIQETWPGGPNSIIERKNAKYTEARPYELDELL